jgi:hypothetical protein
MKTDYKTASEHFVLTTVEMPDGPYRVITDHETGRSLAAKMPVQDTLLYWLFRDQWVASGAPKVKI